jgi:hypothetical protein
MLSVEFTIADFRLAIDKSAIGNWKSKSTLNIPAYQPPGGLTTGLRSD